MVAYSDLNGRAQTAPILGGPEISVAELDAAWLAFHQANNAWLTSAGWIAWSVCPVAPHRERNT